MDELKSKTLRGGLAKVVAQGITLLLRVGALVILARLLEPKDFGLVAMVVALTGVLNLFRDFGLSTATVQSTTVTNDQLSTLFWLNVLVGTVLAFITIAAAPIIASFYGEPSLLSITIALSSGFILNALGIQHAALLQRQMRFVTLAIFDVVSFTGSIAVGITLAMLGFKHWALVAMALVAPLLQSALAWMAASWVPGRPSRRSGVGSMIRLGGTVTLNSLVVYVAYNAEKVLLGRFWGAAALGIYGRAYQLVSIPIEGINSAAGQVAIAAFSRVKEDPPRLKRYFLRSYALVVSVTIPLTLAAALFADDLILVLLGPKWVDVSPVFRALTPTILVYAMINPLWWLLVPLNLVGRSLRIALVLAPSGHPELRHRFASTARWGCGVLLDGHGAVGGTTHRVVCSWNQHLARGHHESYWETIACRSHECVAGLDICHFVAQGILAHGTAGSRSRRAVCELRWRVDVCLWSERLLHGHLP